MTLKKLLWIVVLSTAVLVVSSCNQTLESLDTKANQLETLKEIEDKERLSPPICGSNAVIASGDQYIYDQVDVDNLSDVYKITGLNGLTEISGSITLFNNKYQATISGFSCLERVRSIAVIGSAVHSISGFRALTTLESLTITLNPDLQSVSGFASLPAIRYDLKISQNNALKEIKGFPVLYGVQYSFEINDNSSLEIIDGFSELTQVNVLIWGNIYGDFTLINNSSLKTIMGFSELSEVRGNLVVSGNKSLQSLNGFPTGSPAAFSKLKQVGLDFEIDHNPSLLNITEFTSLELVGNDFMIYDNYNLETIDTFTSLREVDGNFVIHNHPVLSSYNVDIVFSKLKTIGRNFVYERNLNLTNIHLFQSLESVGGYFKISKHPVLKSIVGFNKLSNSDIVGISAVFDNASLDCSNPIPNFSPVDISTGNDVNCI